MILDKLKLRRDGSLVVYRRSGVKSLTWQCRMRLPGSASYRVVSARTPDRTEAIRFALGEYASACARRALGEDPARATRARRATFGRVFEEYARTRAASPDAVKRVRSGALRYFADTPIAEIDEAAVLAYWVHRMSTVSPHPAHRRPPSPGSLVRENAWLRPVFAYARVNKYIGEVPNLVPMRVRRVRNRCPHFTRDEWGRITRAGREWIERARDSAVRRDRTMLFNWLLVMGDTGLRTGEARSLQWRDVRASSAGHVVITVRRGKTGARETVGPPTVATCLKRIYALRRDEAGGDPGPDGAVFCGRDGTPIKSFKAAFRSLLAFAGVPLDGRSAYSARHTFITKMLQDGANPLILAKNCGTSVAMLESNYSHLVTEDVARHLTGSRRSPP